MISEKMTATIMNGYALFWDGIFSNFYPCEIKIGTETFKTSEQMFMYGKAIFFKDRETADAILKAETPKDAKKLGRQVKNYNEELWEEYRRNMMYGAVFEKFKQNKELFVELTSEKWNGLKFVEASPFDRIWGIGYSVDKAFKVDKSKWGRNLLGNVIDEVRIDLINQSNKQNA